MLNENDTVKYAVKVSGQIVSPAYGSIHSAEKAKDMLAEAHKSIAEIVPVDPNGKELLFG